MFTIVDDQQDDVFGDDDNEDYYNGRDPFYYYDYDHDLGHDFDNGCDLDQLQYVDISNGHAGDDVM